MIKKLYEETLRHNFNYWVMKRANKSELILTALGCDNFVIASIYFGVFVIGCRHYNHDTETAEYKYMIVKHEANTSQVEKLIKTYEAKRLNIKRVKIERVESLEG